MFLQRDGRRSHAAAGNEIYCEAYDVQLNEALASLNLLRARRLFYENVALAVC